MKFRSKLHTLGILCTVLLAVLLSSCASQTKQSTPNVVQLPQTDQLRHGCNCEAMEVDQEVNFGDMVSNLRTELIYHSDEANCEEMETASDMLSLDDVFTVADTVKSYDIQQQLNEPTFHLTTDDVISELRLKHQLQCESIETLESDSIKNAGYDKIELFSCLSQNRYTELVSEVQRFCEEEEQKKIFSEKNDVSINSLDRLDSSQLSALYAIEIDEEVCKWVDNIHTYDEVPSDIRNCTTFCSNNSDLTTDIYLSITKNGESSVWSVYNDVDVHLEDTGESYLNRADMKFAGFSTSKLLDLPALYVRLKYIIHKSGGTDASSHSSYDIFYIGMLFADDVPKLANKWIDLYMHMDKGSMNSDVVNEEGDIIEECDYKHQSKDYMQMMMSYDGEWHQSEKFRICRMNEECPRE